MEFDIYHPLEYSDFLDSLKVGAVVELDGIDGFFDQYFEARSPGDVIRFLPIDCPQPFSFVPSNISDFDSIPIIEAEIKSCSEISGTVVLQSIEPFAVWMRALPMGSLRDGEKIEEIDSILDSIPEYSDYSQFYWHRTPEEISRRRVSGVNALYGIPHHNAFRIAVLTSNMLPSWIVSRKKGGEQAGGGQAATRSEST